MEKLLSWLYIKKVNDYRSKGTCGFLQDIELFSIRHVCNKTERCTLCLVHKSTNGAVVLKTENNYIEASHVEYNQNL